jgi:predicted metal-dependent HD superfamily phosphohydrolase
VEEIAVQEGVSDEDIFVLKATAWFHDLGYSKKYKGHEDESIIIAKDFLNKENVPLSLIDRITQGINATRVPQEPKNKLEHIISDADLFDLGTDDYFELSEKLFTEWNNCTRPDDNRDNWLLSLQFMKDHRYFTEYANKVLEPKKQENIRLLEKRLKIS